MKRVGTGTQKVEEELRELFPGTEVLRMDADTVSGNHEQILDKFDKKKIPILLGTQMVAKGLDFDNVSIVGILDADTMLNIPDFRSYERAFHTLSQVAGRAGRKNYKGKVVLQSRSAESDIVAQVVSNDYWGMFSAQMEERKMFSYPPFCRLIYVYMRHRDNDVLEHLSADMARMLVGAFGQQRILGPAQPPVGRVQSMFIRKLIVKMEYGTSVQKVRDALVGIQRQVMSLPYSNGLVVYYDVDPV
jgi:primosomal protein N' (replication factor Y)